MKLSPQEFTACFGALSDVLPTQTPVPAPTEVPHGPQAQAGDSRATKEADIRFSLRTHAAQHLAILCQKHLSPSRTKRESRLAMLSSAAWVCEKQGLIAKSNAAVVFTHNGQRMEGRLDLLAQTPDNHAVLALIVNFAPELAHYEKLKGALSSRYLPILVTTKSNEVKIRQWQRECLLTKKFSSWLKVIYLD